MDSAIEFVDELNDTDRGNTGFGDSGLNKG